MRHHGWQLPYHPLQITAVAGFLALVFAFYIFFIPFVDLSILKISGIAAYSCLVMLVSTSYMWCVAIDPADVHVLSSKKHGSPCKKEVDSSLEHPEPEARISLSLPKLDCCLGHIWMKKSCAEGPLPQNSLIYCSLCKVKISMGSKHCRVCDKCVDGFDHHCRWLNNCVGKRNYRGFVILVISTLFMFILQWTFGLWVLIHRFLNASHFERSIAMNLGASFPFMAYLSVLVLCSVVTMVATYLLGQLAYFHALLTAKGVTTYEYLMAKRNQDTKGGHGHLSDSSADTLQMDVRGSCSRRKQHEPCGQTFSSPFLDYEGSPRVHLCNLKEDKDPGGSWRSFSQRFAKRKASVKINPWNMSGANKGDGNAQSASMASNGSAHGGSARVEFGDSFGSSNQGLSGDLIASLRMGSSSRRFFEMNAAFLDQSVTSTWQNGKLPLDSLEQLDSSESNSGALGSQQFVEGDRLLQQEARRVFKSSHAFCVGSVSSLPSSGEAAPSGDPSGQDSQALGGTA